MRSNKVKGEILMKKITINRELTLTYTDEFHRMSADELIKFCGTSENHSGIYDEENHMLIIVSWTNPGFFNYMTDAKSIIGGAERCMKKNLLNYRREDSFKCEIASKKANGIRFAYTPAGTDIVQVGEMSAFRAKHKFYVIQYISRSEYNAQNRVAYADALHSLKLSA